MSETESRSQTSSRPLQLALLALALVAPLPAVLAVGNSSAPAGTAAALAAGQEVYAYNCSVCHGPTGGGLAEARLAFPPEDRRCTQCHKPNNPVVWPLSRPFVDNDMFDVGTPPALHATEGAGPAPMAAHVPPEALFGYLRATMPRYHPGRQTDVEYWLLTAFLLDMNGRTDAVLEAIDEAVANGFGAPEDRGAEGER